MAADRVFLGQLELAKVLARPELALEHTPAEIVLERLDDGNRFELAQHRGCRSELHCVSHCVTILQIVKRKENHGHCLEVLPGPLG